MTLSHDMAIAIRARASGLGARAAGEGDVTFGANSLFILARAPRPEPILQLHLVNQ